jgi:hypothetical protein
MKQEEWKAVVGFEGFYCVSSAGRILSLERTCETYQGKRRVRQRVLKSTGRIQAGRKLPRIVKLSRPSDEKSEYSTAARLVLTAFVRPPKDGEVAHYKNGDVNDASLENVEWSTYSTIAVQKGYSPPHKTRYASRKKVAA